MVHPFIAAAYVLLTAAALIRVFGLSLLAELTIPGDLMGSHLLDHVVRVVRWRLYTDSVGTPCRPGKPG